MASIRVALLAACCLFSGPAYSQDSTAVPVLSICEALQNLDLYRGKEVVIVAQPGLTFEGTFMGEQCEPDGRILIQDHRWLSTIEYSSDDKRLPRPQVFPADETALRIKLKQVRGSAEPSDKDSSTVSGYGWVAVYGWIDSPVRLKAHPPYRSGNGFGANGTVPARICEISSKTLIQGHGWMEPMPPPRPLLPEPPDLSFPLALPSSPFVPPVLTPGPPN